MENKILDLFLYNNKLKFNEIKNKSKIRSNHLAYHIKNLVNKKILIKNKEYYELNEEYEYLIPYLSKKNSVLSIILIHIGNNKKCFLIKRKKRPFIDKLSLPGGRIILGESIKGSVKRLMKEKYNINATLQKINSISLEHLKKNNKIKHSYLLIFVSAKTKDKIFLSEISKNKKNIISSDLYLIKNDINKKINIKTLNTLKF